MSTHISIVTNGLFFVLLALSIAGIILCFFLDGSTKGDTYIEEYKNDTIRLDQQIF